MPWELEEGWFLLAEGIQEGCMEEGSLTGLEEWGGSSRGTDPCNPNVQRNNPGPPSFLSSPCPFSEQGLPPDSIGINPVYACNLLLFLPQNGQHTPEAKPSSAGLKTQARLPGPLLFPGVLIVTPCLLCLSAFDCPGT